MARNTNFEIKWNGWGAVNWSTGLARNFDWGGGANYKSHAMTSSEFSAEELFVGQRYCRMEDQQPWPCLTLSKYFALARKLKSKLKNENV